MNFIELTLKSNEKIALNAGRVEAVGFLDGKTCLTMKDETECYYIVKEPYSEVVAKIHKVKRLEIASRIFGHVHQSFLGMCNGETIRKESLIMAEELIKQNEVME